MEEQTTTERTSFGRVLCAILEARGMGTGPEALRALAERSGLDADKFLALMTSNPRAGVGPVNGLDDELRLTTQQKKALAMAYVYDRDVVTEAIQRSDAFNDAYFAIEGGVVITTPAARERALAVLAEERDKAHEEVERLKAAIRGEGEAADD